MQDPPDQAIELTPQSAPDLDFEDVTDLKNQKQELRETILHTAAGDLPNQFRPTSAVIYGPTGSGKRRLLRATAGELGDHGYDVLRITSLHESGFHPSEYVEELFDAASESQPLTILLDCMDEIFDDEIIRKVAQKIDTIREQGQEVIVLSVMESDQLHGPNRGYLRHVDVVVELERPGLARRENILQDRLERAGESVDSIDVSDYDLRRLARETDRFGVGDLERFVRRLVATVTSQANISPSVEESDIVEVIRQVDTERVEKLVDEETLTDVDVPNVTFDDVGGHAEAKRRLHEQVDQVLSNQDTAEAMGITFGNGILLHGPPGTGKTMLVRALANELNHTFIPVNSSILKGGRGSPAQLIPGLFYRAQRNSPSILFFDEFDLLGTRRGTVGNDDTAVNTLLTELDGVQQLDGVMVIAATNRPETLDPALLRPGRFDYHLEIGSPSQPVQADIFETHTEEMPLAEDVTPEWFAEMTDAVTGAEISAICERAVTIGMRDQEPDTMTLSRGDLQDAYADFERGRLFTDDIESSPAFQ